MGLELFRTTHANFNLLKSSIKPSSHVNSLLKIFVDLKGFDVADYDGLHDHIMKMVGQKNEMVEAFAFI